jgi:hypothetical protein
MVRRHHRRRLWRTWFAQASVAGLSMWNVWLFSVVQHQNTAYWHSNSHDVMDHRTVSLSATTPLKRSDASRRHRRVLTDNLSVTTTIPLSRAKIQDDTYTLGSGGQQPLHSAQDHTASSSSSSSSSSSRNHHAWDTPTLPRENDLSRHTATSVTSKLLDSVWAVNASLSVDTLTPLTTTRSVPPSSTRTTVSSRNHALRINDMLADTPSFQVWEQYQQWHSASVLQSESLEQLQQRRYALAFYSCPHQVGNRMHHFLNALIWSIVTNRTVLVHYLDTAACESLAQRQVQITWRDRKQCPSANTQRDCNDILALAPWLPSYHDVASRLAWPSRLSKVAATRQPIQNDTHTDIHNATIPVLVDYWSISSYLLAPEWERSRFPPLPPTTNNRTQSAEYAAKVDQLDDHVLVDFPELVGKQSVLDRSMQRQHLLVTEPARNRASALTHAGMEFLYGWLFAQSFALQGIPSSLLLHNNNDIAAAHRPLQMVLTNNNTKENSTAATSTATVPYAIALHSRHRQGQDGTNIRAETKCLRQLLDGRNNATSLQCRVCLMSDRPATVLALATWLQTEYPMCIVVDAAKAVPPRNASAIAAATSFRMEHGPNAGAAFVHELNVCQHYTDAFIGTAKGGSSSTALLEEWIAYQHYLKTKPSPHLMLASELPKPTAKCWL